MHVTDPARRAVAGPVLFARYAYPPNALGYCGPDDPAALLQAAHHSGDLDLLRHLAGHFEGAWPYLQLIAATNHITDPLDRRVVEAYWVGNTLSRHVPSAALHHMAEDRFARRAGRNLPSLLAPLGLGVVATHSFHVFAVYPWVGLLRAGAEGAALTVLDRCRIRWGTVEAVSGDTATVRTQLLRFDGWRLQLGPPQPEQVRLRWEGAQLAADVEPGAVVSLHWDWVCDRLDPAGLRALRSATAQNLHAVNAAPVPGPGAAADRHG